MHGNEVLGRECLLNLAYVLCHNYGKSNFITQLVDSTRIHIMPSMNPDGWEMSSEGTSMVLCIKYCINIQYRWFITLTGDRQGEHGRSNYQNVDLNRNFPCREPVLCAKDYKPTQIETSLVMDWSLNFPFVLSANLHGGSLVVNYPYDDKSLDGNYAAPDRDLFKVLSYTYAKVQRFVKLLQCFAAEQVKIFSRLILPCTKREPGAA